MIHCSTCNADFKTRAAFVSHTKSGAHEHRRFQHRHNKFYIAVTPTELELLQGHGLKHVVYGPRIITRPGWIRRRQKTRENPWVKKSEVRRVLTLGVTLQALLRRVS